MNPEETNKDAPPPVSTPPSPPPTPPEKPKNQRARVLGGFQLDGVDYYPNDVIEAGSDLIQSLGSSVDPDPSAVAQAIKNEAATVKKHSTK